MFDFSINLLIILLIIIIVIIIIIMASIMLTNYKNSIDSAIRIHTIVIINIVTVMVKNQLCQL